MSTKSADEIILSLPRKEQVIVKRLRALILDCLPRAEEKVSYGVPFYRHNKMICFIWPPSILWGPKRTIETQQAIGVTLGFCQGNLMANEDGLLLAEGRKQVYCMYFHSLEDIKDDQLRPLLFEAELIDDSFAKKKIKRTQP
jgi:hypothetical protein